jgi:hypothetical protein
MPRRPGEAQAAAHTKSSLSRQRERVMMKAAADVRLRSRSTAILQRGVASTVGGAVGP